MGQGHRDDLEILDVISETAKRFDCYVKIKVGDISIEKYAYADRNVDKSGLDSWVGPSKKDVDEMVSKTNSEMTHSEMTYEDDQLTDDELLFEPLKGLGGENDE